MSGVDAGIPQALGVVAGLGSTQVWAWGAGAVFAALSLALWFASRRGDRLALRLFSLRYGIGALAWFFLHPRQFTSDTALRFPSVITGIVLLVLTLVALDLYLGRFTRLRLALVLSLALAVLVVLRWQADVAPTDARPLFVAWALAMAWGSALALAAARRERNAGHLLVGLALLSYPLLVLAALLWMPMAAADLAYLVAVPAALAGLAVLLASLVRSSDRLAAELQRRQAAEREVLALNTTLEERVQARTSELQTLVQGLEAFTRNVSHDLRGPLAGIPGVARLAQQALALDDPDRAALLLEPLAPQADRLRSMVDGLLRLSRVTQGDCQRKLQPMRPLLDAAIQQLALEPSAAGILPEVALDLGPLPEAPVDGSLMQQVFVNLVANALRFARSGTSTPQVRVGAERNNGHVTFFVADNGPGVPKGREGELFKPFARLHPQGLSHNGIGLSIVQLIIAKHHGRIWVEGAPGGGAVFRFQLG